MKRNDIMKYVDHTLLSQSATWEEIRSVCDDGIKYSCASVCIPPSFIKMAAEYVKISIKICTVIGFPNGYNTSFIKASEASEAVKNGADEIDMVINIGMLKEKKYDAILDEINSVKKACDGRILKVIIETCLLTEEEKIKMCQIISDSNADFIKTSTGFSVSGATIDDIKLFAENVDERIKIKAAGGISSFEDAEKFISLGASRLGTSRLVKILKNETTVKGY